MKQETKDKIRAKSKKQDHYRNKEGIFISPEAWREETRRETFSRIDEVVEKIDEIRVGQELESKEASADRQTLADTKIMLTNLRQDLKDVWKKDEEGNRKIVEWLIAISKNVADGGSHNINFRRENKELINSLKKLGVLFLAVFILTNLIWGYLVVQIVKDLS